MQGSVQVSRMKRYYSGEYQPKDKPIGGMSNNSHNDQVHAFFYMQRFFLTQPQCCLTLSLHCLQMLLRCCLIHITIIIRRHNLYLVYLFFLIFSLIFIVINHITSFCIFLNNFFYYFWMITWMKKVNNLQIAKVQLQCVA